MKGRNEIREVFNKGKRYVCKGGAGCSGAKIFVMKNGLPRNRICFTFPRGFGNAVKRNHARRLGREAYRSLKPRLQWGNDMIILVYPEDARATFTGRLRQLQFLLGRAGLLQ